MILKILFIFFPLFFLGGKAPNQTPPDTPKTNALQELKSDMREFKEATEDLKNTTPAEPPKTIIKYRTKKVFIPCKYATVVIGGDTVVVSLQQFEGSPFIDADNIRDAIGQTPGDDDVIDSDTMTQAAMEHADEQIKGWKLFKQKVGYFFKRKN